MNYLKKYILAPYYHYSTKDITLEIIAVLFGIISVIYSSYTNILVYPTGIISTCIYIYLLFNWRLFGDMLINIYYTIMSIYGWILWSSYSENGIQITRMNSEDWNYAYILFIGSFILVLIVYYFKPVISNNFSLKELKKCNLNYSWIEYVDCFTTSIFLVGMYTMAEMKVENWLFWIVGNSFAIVMYIVKKHALTAIQFVIFLALAISGYISWVKLL